MSRASPVSRAGPVFTVIMTLLLNATKIRHLRYYMTIELARASPSQPELARASPACRDASIDLTLIFKPKQHSLQSQNSLSRLKSRKSNTCQIWE